MSGGKFDYKDDELKRELFGWDYDDEYKYNATYGDPMHDRQLSMLVFDVLTLLHELDWAESGDTNMDDYEKAKKKFKKKWFNDKSNHKILKALIEDMFLNTKKECLAMLGK